MDRALRKSMNCDLEKFFDDFAFEIVYVTTVTGWELEYILKMPIIRFRTYIKKLYEVQKELQGTEGGQENTVATFGGNI